LLEVSSLLEIQNESLEKNISEKDEQLEMAECDIYRLEKNAVSNEIMQDANLIQGLFEALEQNKQVIIISLRNAIYFHSFMKKF
jgi:hypothetical protein